MALALTDQDKLDLLNQTKQLFDQEGLTYEIIKTFINVRVQGVWFRFYPNTFKWTVLVDDTVEKQKSRGAADFLNQAKDMLYLADFDQAQEWLQKSEQYSKWRCKIQA